MRVALVQHDIAWVDRESNFEHLRTPLALAAAGGARLALVTETFSTGFAVESPGLAEPEDGPSSGFLREQATELGIWVGGSCPEIPAGSDPADRRPANSFVLAGPEGEVHRYHKIHPFASERNHFRSGTQTNTVTIDGMRLTLAVCYDVRFANVFWERALETDAYLVIANFPEVRRNHWKVLLQARAVENQAYVVGVNRVGEAPGGLRYSGDSMVVDPLGEIVVSAAGEETVLFADINAARVAEVRTQFPFLADRVTL